MLIPVLFTKNLAFKENLKINNVNTYFIYIYVNRPSVLIWMKN